jgi:leader peptidase (prepilin peptidase) / N-methyltransferase
MTTVVIAALCGVIGLAAGSVLTKVVPRLPQGRSLRTPSRCEQCDHQLGAVETVPIASWVVQRNRCRWCRAPIGIAPLLVEAATTLLFVAFAVRLGPDPAVAAYCVLAAGLVALTAIDFQLHRLPREVTYVTFALGAPLLLAAALLDDEPGRMIGAAAGGVLALGVLWLGDLASRGSLGEGDVRLAPLLGFYLGYVSVSTVVIGLIAGFALGAAAGLALVVIRRANEPYPFGPFLAAGTLITLLVVGTG